jgi:hypothetical protein
MLITIQDRFCRALWIPETRPGSARELLQSLICWLNARPRRKHCAHCGRPFWTSTLSRSDHCSPECYRRHYPVQAG